MWLFQPLGLLLILFWHWIADFVCQSHDQATNKWQSNRYLMEHTGMYTLVWLPIIAAIACTVMPRTPLFLLFFPITFVTHTITDYITSRESHKFFDKKDLHNGFVVVGFDQILHYIQLFLTFKFLLNA